MLVVRVDGGAPVLFRLCPGPWCHVWTCLILAADRCDYRGFFLLKLTRCRAHIRHQHCQDYDGDLCVRHRSEAPPPTINQVTDGWGLDCSLQFGRQGRRCYRSQTLSAAFATRGISQRGPDRQHQRPWQNTAQQNRRNSCGNSRC